MVWLSRIRSLDAPTNHTASLFLFFCVCWQSLSAYALAALAPLFCLWFCPGRLTLFQVSSCCCCKAIFAVFCSLSLLFLATAVLLLHSSAISTAAAAAEYDCLSFNAHFCSLAFLHSFQGLNCSAPCFPLPPSPLLFMVHFYVNFFCNF